SLEEARSESHDVLVDATHTDSFQQLEAGGQRGNVQEVRRSVLERFGVILELKHFVLHGRKIHSSAREPRATQPAECIVSDDKRAHTRRISEQLVERQHDKLRRVRTQAEWIARHEGGGVEQDVESLALRLV